MKTYSILSSKELLNSLKIYDAGHGGKVVKGRWRTVRINELVLLVRIVRKEAEAE